MLLLRIAAHVRERKDSDRECLAPLGRLTNCRQCRPGRSVAARGRQAHPEHAYRPLDVLERLLAPVTRSRGQLVGDFA